MIHVDKYINLKFVFFKLSFSQIFISAVLQVHYEGKQKYIDGLGTARSTSHHNSAGLITLPPSQGTREWLVTGLAPNTYYILNLTGTITTSEQATTKIYSQPATIEFTTDYDAPANVDRPEQDRRKVNNDNNQQVYLRLHRASTKNGPIDRYYIVVHLLEYAAYQSYVPQEVKNFNKNKKKNLDCNFFLLMNRFEENVVIQQQYLMNQNYLKCFYQVMEK